MVGKLIPVILLLVISTQGMAHGDLHQRINLVTAAIEKSPNNPALFFQRGSLHLQHQSYKKAIQDFRRSIKKGGANARQYYGIAKARFELGQFHRCIKQLSKILHRDAGNTNVYYLLSQSFEQIGKFDQAAHWAGKYFDVAILKRPDHYLALAHAHGLENRYDMEIHWLEMAIQQFGHLPSIVKSLLNAYKKSSQLDLAIKLQSEVIAKQKRKEFALFERVKLYQLAEDYQAARTDLLEMGKEIDKLPSHIQGQKSILELKERIRLETIAINDRH